MALALTLRALKCEIHKPLGKAFTFLLLITLLSPQPFVVVAAQELIGGESKSESTESSLGGGESSSLLSSDSAEFYQPWFSGAQVSAKLSSINEISGAYTYSLPLVAPPGRNSVEPNLSLSYNSQSRETQNIAGYGWDIPIPYIERQNKIGIEDLYETNTFYASFSGELATTSSSEIFVPKSDDGSFFSYAFASSTNEWTVLGKNGHIYKFGHATNSRMYNLSTTTEAFRWMLEEERDADGNYIKYEYFKDTGFPYPSVITYTGHDTTDGIFTVEFNYEQRSDNASSTAARFETETKYRVNEVVMSIDGEWVRKYELAYTTGDNGNRSLLEAVTESARTEEVSPSTLSFPPTTFTYQASDPGWATTTDFALPHSFLEGEPVSPWGDTGLRVVDVNGDALPDLIYAPSSSTTKVYINNGTGWDHDSEWYFPVKFNGSTIGDTGVRLADLNGDGLVDIIQRLNVCLGGGQDITLQYLNTGTGWATTTNWASPLVFLNCETGRDIGTRLVDINGDGLVDMLRAERNISGGDSFNSNVYINNGTDFVSSSLKPPVATVLASNAGSFINHEALGTRFADVNNDGLMDIVTRDTNQWNSLQGVFMNTGTGWEKKDTWEVPHVMAVNKSYQGQHLADVNGDGLVDYIEGDGDDVYINNGSNWVLDASWVLPIDFYNLGDYTDGYSTTIVDVDGDGMVDMIQRDQDAHRRYLSNGKPADILVHIDESSGGEIDITYGGSAALTDGLGNLVNPNLPFVVQVATDVVRDDGLGTLSTTTYQYKYGSYYFGTLFDKMFAGFGLIEKTDPVGNITKVYRHQGNDTASTSGELSDSYAKIGRIYREEQYDNSDNLFKLTINKWDQFNRGTGAEFVNLATTSSLLYDGDGDHKDTAESYTYSTTTGDVLSKVEWGEVSGDTDGSFTDSGSDKRTTVISYAASTTGYLVLPSQETVTDQSATKVRETRNYYDTLSLGSVNAGNPTKQETWVSGSDYVDTERTYNTYGLVTQEKDQRDNTTTYAYDSFNLYPATTTNPLSHVVAQLYDYSSGKAKQITDANGRVFQTILDAFDRVIEEKQPDLSSPSSLVTNATYEYVDTGMPRRVKKTSYLNSATSTDMYTYVDGLGRTVEERTEAEDSNYTIKHYFYGVRGLLESESLPFFGSGIAYTGTSSPATNSLLTRYSYDALSRTTAIANVVGTTTNAYDQWVVTTTDANGEVKESTSDAYGNLVQVVENNGGSPYTTAYEYNRNDKLTKLTDAEGNVRNFTYDGLGRRLTAQDLHAPADGTYGTWTYTYDSASNLATSTDPKSQTVEYSYDGLNRALVEDYTGSGGSEITYAYDTCSEGKGKLCFATTTDAVTGYAYNALGGIDTETRTIDGTSYVTSYEYDRQGHITDLTYPDTSVVKYTYDNAGLLDTIARKPAGGSEFLTAVSEMQYAPNGAVALKRLGNGVVSTYTYDAGELYRLKNILTLASTTWEGGGGLALLGGGGSSFAPSQGSPFASATMQNSVLAISNKGVGYDNGWGIGGMLEDDTVLFDEEGSIKEVGSATSTETLPEEQVLGVMTEATSTEEVLDAESPTVETGATSTPSEINDQTASTTPEVIDIATTTPSDNIEETERGDVVSEESILVDSYANLYLDKGGAYEFDMPQQMANAGSAKVEIMKTHPEVRLKKWNGEVDLGVSYEKVKATGARAALTNRVEWKGATEEVHAYPLDAKEGMEDGGFEIEVYLTEKPETNVFNFIIDGAENLDFFYQPELTPEEVKDGSRRPENVLGSYAVYHKDMKGYREGGVNYATGKAFHIYRPKAIDAEGNEIWGTLALDNNTLSVEIPEEFFEKAKYPVRVDPTFGYTSAGGSSIFAPSQYRGSLFTSPSDYGTFSSMSFYCSALTPDNLKSTIVIHSSLNIATNATSTGASCTSTAGWKTPSFSATPGLSASTDYLLGVIGDGNRAFIHYDTGSTDQGHWDSSNSYSTPQDLGSVIHDTKKYSAYITYSASSGNQAPTAPTALQVEDQTNPTNITDSTPEFDAIFQDPNATSTAVDYRIQVATSSAFTTTYWDTGTTTLASSTPVGMRIADISYSGSALASSTTYYWRIKFWDETGLEGAWSTTTSTFSLAASTTPNYAPTAPSALKTEGQTNPTDVSDPTPEFTAVYNDPNAGDSANKYQLQVATTSAFTSIFWDSGTTTMATTSLGATSPSLAYAGSSLASSTTYYWRIKFWDVAGLEGEWSTTTSTFALDSGPTPPALGVVLQNISYTYDAVGNITQITDYSDTGAGKTVNLGYDDLHRLTSAATAVASSTSFSHTYAYNSIGNITNKSDTGSYTYAGTGYANPHAATQIASTAYSYDNNGNVSSAGAWNYAWDYRNRLAQAGSGVATSTYGYDQANQRVKKTVGSDTTAYPNKYYNTDGTTETMHIFAGNDLVATIELSEGDEGGGGEGTTVFLDSFTEEDDTPLDEHTPDQGGSWVKIINTGGSCDLEVENSGYLNEGSCGSSDGALYRTASQASDADVEISVLQLNGDTSDDTNVLACRIQDANNMYAFEWNESSGQLYKRVSGTWSTLGSATTGVADDSTVSLICEGDTITAEDDGNELESVTDSSITAAGYGGIGMGAVINAGNDGSGQELDDFDMQVLGGGGGSSGTTTRYLHTDHLGGMNVTSDETGLADEVVDYHPYGTERIRLGDTQDQRQYAGTERDQESDLDYMINRYYSSTNGQFLSQDPVFWEIGATADGKSVLTNPQFQNSYSYASGNPIVNKDPNGRFSIGFSYSGNLEGGLGAFSASYASANISLVVDPATRQVYLVQSNSGAVNSGYMNNYQSAPNNGKVPFVLGLHGGRGASLSFSPYITNPNDITSVENSVNVNLPVVSFSAQGEENGNPTYSFGAGAKGVASVSYYPVATQVTNVYSVNQVVSNTASQVSNYYQSAISSIQSQINSIQSKINEYKAGLQENN